VTCCLPAELWCSVLADLQQQRAKLDLPFVPYAGELGTNCLSFSCRRLSCVTLGLISCRYRRLSSVWSPALSGGSATGTVTKCREVQWIPLYLLPPREAFKLAGSCKSPVSLSSIPSSLSSSLPPASSVQPQWQC